MLEIRPREEGTGNYVATFVRSSPCDTDLKAAHRRIICDCIRTDDHPRACILGLFNAMGPDNIHHHNTLEDLWRCADRD